MSFPVEVLVQSWFVCGPTAVGKTALSLQLAAELDAEIISLDSMAIYKGMDIGTAKPSAAERSLVPHHLIDVALPDQEFSVSDFLELAAAAARGILERGRAPLFVGGTGLYLRSILRGMSTGPQADWQLRHELQEFAATAGNRALHDRLRAVDVTAAKRLHPNDIRRVIRAIEVAQNSPATISDSQQHGPRPPEQRPLCAVWLEPPRDWLRQRIDLRVDKMIADGLLEEVQHLMRLDPPISRTARQALGYRELIAHLEGLCSLDEAVAQIKVATRQFAKRQHTWFRNLEECTALAVDGSESVDSLCQRLRAAARIRAARDSN